jgi:hypothetical protein
MDKKDIENQIFLDALKTIFLPTEWTTAEGINLEISKMETKHLKNCIAFLVHNDFTINIYSGHGEDGSVEHENHYWSCIAMKMELAKRANINNK